MCWSFILETDHETPVGLVGLPTEKKAFILGAYKCIIKDKPGVMSCRRRKLPNQGIELIKAVQVMSIHLKFFMLGQYLGSNWKT